MTVIRRSVMPLLAGMLVLALAWSTTGTFAQTVAGGTPAPPPAPSGAPAQSPEQQAMAAAARIANPAERVTALEKIRTDFPQASILPQVDAQLLTTLLITPERTAEIGVVVDRMIARIPATATPEARFLSTATPVSQLVARKVLLDRAEKLLADAVAGLDFEKYLARQNETARNANRPEPSRTSLETGYNQSYFARAKYELGRILAAKGDTAGAEAALKSSLALYPIYPMPVAALATLYADTGEKAKAEAFLTDLMKATPPNPAALSPLVAFYEKENQLDKAEALLRSAQSLPNLQVTAMMGLVSFFERQNQPDKAEAVLKDALSKTPINITAMNTLVSTYERKNAPEKAEAVLRDVVSRDAAVANAWLQLAKIEQKRGDDAKALDAYLQAGAGSYLRGADLEAMKSLYRKVRGSDAGLEAELDKRAHALPKAVTPVKYTATRGRTDRVVLFEMFTGSGCPPCVAADLAFDAVMARYPNAAIVPIAYHVHIPAPDPMTTAESEARRLFYSVTGVPTAQIDGVMVAGATGGNLGGGGRDRSATVYDAYMGLVDKALETPAQAAVAVKAIAEGDQIAVTANVSKLPADAKDLRLHIVIAEKELMFGGENGIRQHPMVVRALAGEKGLGLPLAATGETKHTFSLAAIRTDITKSLEAELARRGTPPAGSPNAPAAAGRAMTTIDPAHLVVVAFVQGPDKKILQATRADVVVGSPSPGRTQR